MFLLNAIVTLYGEPRPTTTSNGKTIFVLRGFLKEKKRPTDDPNVEQNLSWITIRVWGGRHDKLIPYLKHSAKIFVAGTPHFQTFLNGQGELRKSIQLSADHVSIIRFAPRPNEESNVQDKPALQTVQEPTYTQEVSLPVREDDQSSFSSDWGF